MTNPAWSTPERREYLVRLFERSRGFCVFGHQQCRNDGHHYQVFIEDLIDTWKAQDRERREYEWKLEQRRLHHGERGRFGRRFDPVARDVFMASQPEYYLVGLGVNPFTFKRVALVRIPSTYVHLFVDVASAVKGLSKSKRRKIARYGAEPPTEAMESIHSLCQKAVRRWWRT